MYQTNTIIGIEHQCYNLAPLYIISYLKKRETHKYQIWNFWEAFKWQDHCTRRDWL